MNRSSAPLADQAASLLPEPPPEDDPFGYLAWEELVLQTARRLLQVTDDPLDVNCADGVHLASPSRRLDGPALLALATLLADTDDVRAGEVALWQAVRETRTARSHESSTRRCRRAVSSSAAPGKRRQQERRARPRASRAARTACGARDRGTIAAPGWSGLAWSVEHLHLRSRPGKCEPT